MADMEIFMIIDGSGSMTGVKHDVVNGVNDFIKEQQDSAKNTGDDVRFSLTAFDSNIHEVYVLEDIDFVNPVTVADTYLGGGTALYDAIGQTISKADDNGTPKLVVVYTDGHENQSREFKAEDIKKIISDFEATGDWQFVYMSAELADFAQPQEMGFAAGNVITGATRGTTNAHFHKLSNSAAIYRMSDSTDRANMLGHYYSSTMSQEDIAAMGGQLAEDIEPTKVEEPAK